ncbi:MAG: hypothetical protein ACPGD5_08900 [Salibacteraceae bacterium]
MLLLYSCKPYKELQSGEYFVNKVKVRIESDSGNKKHELQNSVIKDELYQIIKQKPNRKVLGVFKLGINFYAYGIRKDNWFRRWAKKAGDEFVILDTASSAISFEQQRLYLIKKGYFLNEGNYEVIYQDSHKRKATIIYTLTPKKPYKIKEINKYIEDHKLRAIADSIGKESLIKRGKNYDEFVLINERKRIETNMKNRGYYNFDKSYVSYDVDSNLGNKGVALQVNVSNPTEKRTTANGADTTISFPHRKYSIQEVYIQVKSNDKRYTTVDTAKLKGYVFVNSSKNSIRPNVILRTLYFKPGDQYKLENIQYTYNRLAALKAFSSININVRPRTVDPQDTTLVAFIDLKLSSRHLFTVETEGTNRGGNLGINGNVKIANKNTFKGAEVFQIKLHGGLEAQGTSFEDDPENNSGLNNSPFNTFEYGAELGLRLPELFIPKNRSKIPKYDNPGTIFSVGYNHQYRSAYDRDIFSAKLNYDWYLNRMHGFKVSLVDLSVVRIDKQDWFEEKLVESGNSLLQNSYQNHLISATRFQYEFTNQKKTPNYVYFKTSVESAGNILRAVNNLSGTELDSTGSYYTLFDIRYAQYVMVDADIRYHSKLTEHTETAYRIYGGLGVPLTNLNVLPFEKSYYGGGANFNRAWISRTMGPGGMADTGSLASIDRIGDIKLEANFEYRFDIIGDFKGAYFIDVGNIWIREKDPQRPLAEFDINRFYKELAVGSGIGFRYDAGFFVIRLDVGVKIHDPKLFTGERWLWQDKPTHELLSGNNYYREIFNWNLAIDYPF